ncbi:MAG: replication protein [Firmicutes bacterium]|nr:replication protein [Bacillota bacterium]
MDYSKQRATWWTGVLYHQTQLTWLVEHSDVKHYAYILHDKDRMKDGEPKKPHFHFLVQLCTNQRGAWFKQFETDDLGMIFPKPSYSPKGAYDYLIHDTAHARKENKFLYCVTERTSTIEGFDSEEKDELDENKELLSDIQNLLDGLLTWREFLMRKPKRIHMISNIRIAYDLLKAETLPSCELHANELKVNGKPFKRRREIAKQAGIEDIMEEKEGDLPY